jgi:GT2 family glycosyltransferase
VLQACAAPDEKNGLAAMAEMNSPSVLIIVLNWNGKSDTLECLASLQSITYPSLKIVVIDNGSTDDSEETIKEAFPNVTVIQNGENLGYAEGNNVGIRHAMECGADFVFVLNNDTITDANVVSALVVQAGKNPNAAILGPKIYFYEQRDTINSAGGHLDYETLARGHIGHGVRDDGSVYASVVPVEWVTGCAMLLRLSALREVGVFDSDYFLICEDLDLCTRMRKRGFEILFVPEAKLWHKVSAAFDGNFSAVYCYYFFRNILLYAWKNFADRRFALYRKLLRDSREFYRRLKRTGDADYRRKGFCIVMGVIHFFAAIWGKAPEWIFTINFSHPGSGYENQETAEHPSIAVGDIGEREKHLAVSGQHHYGPR